MKEKILGQAQTLQPMLLDIRRDLHRHPETGFDLTYTKEKVRKELIDMGYEPVDCGKAGLVALVGGKQPGKTIMLRADMDALAKCMAVDMTCTLPCYLVQPKF